MNKLTPLVLAIASIGVGTYSQNLRAAMASDARLLFDAGELGCIDGLGTPPDNCESALAITSGSYWAFDTNNDGIFEPGSRIALEMGTQGLIVNSTQSTAGDIDTTWMFLCNPGNFMSASDTTILSDDSAGAVTLDFSGWEFTWNGISSIPLGGGTQDCGTDTDGVCTLGSGVDTVDLAGILDNGTGVANITCGNTCELNDTFELTYFARVTYDDPSSFGGVPYALRMTGTVGAVPVPAAVWLFSSGLLGLLTVARSKARS